MAELSVEIVRYGGDEPQPGWVECRIEDAWGKTHVFVDKVPILTASDLNKNSSYPQHGAMACEVIRRWKDAQDRALVTIDTQHPWQIESSTGETRFDVLATQLIEP